MLVIVKIHYTQIISVCVFKNFEPAEMVLWSTFTGGRIS